MRKTVYQLDAHFWFAGEAEAFECEHEPGVFLLPAGCVEEAPPAAVDGMRARHIPGLGWRLEAWVAPPARDPVAVLAEFLRQNPDVAALVKP